MALAPRSLRGDELGELRESRERDVAQRRQRELLKLERVRELRAEKKRTRQKTNAASATKQRNSSHLSAAAVRRAAAIELEQARKASKVERWMAKTGHLSDSLSSPVQPHLRVGAIGGTGHLPAPRAVVRRIAGGTYERCHSAIADVSITLNAGGALGMGSAADRAKRAAMPLPTPGATDTVLLHSDAQLSSQTLAAQGTMSGAGMVYDPLTGGFVHRPPGGGGVALAATGQHGAATPSLGRTMAPSVAGSSNAGGFALLTPLGNHAGSPMGSPARSHADTAYAHSTASTRAPGEGGGSGSGSGSGPPPLKQQQGSPTHSGASQAVRDAARQAAIVARLEEPVPLYNPSSGTLRLGPRRPPVPLFAKKPPTPTADEVNNSIDMLERKVNQLPEPGDNITDAGMGELMSEMERFDAHSVQFRLVEVIEKAVSTAKLAADAAWAAVRNAEGAVAAANMLAQRKKMIADQQKKNVPQNRIHIRSVKEMLEQQGTFRPPPKIRGWSTKGRRKSRLFFSSFSSQDSFA